MPRTQNYRQALFHIQHQYETLANTLSRLAKGATSRRKKLHERINRAGQRGPGETLASQWELARQTETHAVELARDIRTLTQWTVITHLPGALR